jgi:hypothetical protein
LAGCDHRDRCSPDRRHHHHWFDYFSGLTQKEKSETLCRTRARWERSGASPRWVFTSTGQLFTNTESTTYAGTCRKG